MSEYRTFSQQSFRTSHSHRPWVAMPRRNAFPHSWEMEDSAGAEVCDSGWWHDAAPGAAGADWEEDDAAGAAGDSAGGGSRDWSMTARRWVPRRKLRSAGAAGDDEGGGRPECAHLDAARRRQRDMFMAIAAQLHPDDGAGAPSSEEEWEEERQRSPESVPASSEERHGPGSAQPPWHQAVRYVPGVQGMPWSAKERKRRRELSAEAHQGGPTGAGGSSRQMAGARARQADHFCGHSAARQKTAPAAAAGAAVDADGANEVAVGGSGSRASGSADAWWSTSPEGRAEPGAAPQRQGTSWRRNSPSVRFCVKGPQTGGHDCPMSADPRRTERNRRKKAKKFAAAERFLASAGDIDIAVYREQAKDRIFERFYCQQVRRLETARPSP